MLDRIRQSLALRLGVLYALIFALGAAAVFALLYWVLANTLQARERAHILRVCQATAWKIKGADGAARKLGLNPGTLYARMKKLGLSRPEA